MPSESFQTRPLTITLDGPDGLMADVIRVSRG